MPISDVDQFFKFPRRASSQQHLVSLVKGLRELLWILSEKNWSYTSKNNGTIEYLPDDIREDMTRALEELDPHFQRLIDKTETLEHATIADHGLTGSQLRVKTSLLKKFWEIFKGNPVHESLSNLLEMIDVPLESLIGAAGLGGAISELKDSLKAALLIR